jgi:hypothetical protein
MAQLLRAKVGDWDQGVLRLWDDKGRRDAAREHLLPLGPRGAELVEGLITRARGKAVSDANPSLFLSTDRHGQPATVAETTPGKRLVEIASTMGCEPFNLRDVRRTVETELQRLRIPRDVRAVLLSHGLGGVQGKHYERFDFMDEKRGALVAWERHLDQIAGKGTGANVVDIKRRA